MKPADEYSIDIGLMYENMKMSGKSERMNLKRLILLQAVFPARIYRLPGIVKAWLDRAVEPGSSFDVFFRSVAQSGVLLRMCPACYRPRRGGILPSYFKGWKTSGISSPGGFWTLNFSELPSVAVGSSLSDIIETDVPREFYLNPTPSFFKRLKEGWFRVRSIRKRSTVEVVAG